MPSLSGRIVRYRGRKLHLIALVEELSALKRRPVCSTDIREHLAGQDHHEVGYLQALGQILIKAAILRPGSIPRLHAVGIHRNRSYYASTKDERWEAAFVRFCATERAEYLQRRGFLHCLPQGSPRSALERAAACSLRAIIEDTAGYMDPVMLRHHLDLWLEQHPRSQGATPPCRHLSRRQALALLKRETTIRAGYIPSMNYNRHLARVSPTILRCGHPPAYCAEVVRSYCAFQWPMGAENPDREAASLLQWILVMVRVARSKLSLPA